MKTTLTQLVSVAGQAEKLFEKAAKAWETGNNSGNTERMTIYEKRCEDYRKLAEDLLAPFGITCDYPGLHPSFKVNGFGHHSVMSALSAAVGEIVAGEAVACV